MPYSYCPKCDHKVDVGLDPDIGLRLSCESCQAELVVVWLNPVELMINDFMDYEQFEGDLYDENFQKISKKKGEYNGYRKTQEKHQKNHRNKENT